MDYSEPSATMFPSSNSISGSTSWAASQQSGRLGMSPVELQRRAHQRLAERIDLSKSRHKPLSILRQEGRRVVDHGLHGVSVAEVSLHDDVARPR